MKKEKLKGCTNNNLQLAKINKNDEFYTLLEDIGVELYHYKNHFDGKVVYCNCDDPKSSNFFKYFYLKMDELNIKEIVCSCYNMTDRSYAVRVFKDEVPEELKSDETLTLDNVVITRPIYVYRLKDNGDFRSEECINFLKEADIVATNPPFSLFREFIATLMKYNKKFVIIGNKNALTCKEIFPLFKENRVWLGYTSPKEFIEPSGATGAIIKRKLGFCTWFTNLEIKKRKESLLSELYKTYEGNEQDYPKYDNYDAINVDKVSDIPVDYKGVMGVPITFLDKYNSDEFEIVSLRKGDDGKDLVFTRERETIQPYTRVLIRRL